METQGPHNGEDALEHYLQVVADKTGSLIAASARFGAMVSGAPSEIKETLTVFGEKSVSHSIWQMMSSIFLVNHINQEETPGTDLREGVPTLVTLNVMKSTRAEDRELIKLLKAPIKDEAVVAQVLSELRVHPALDQSRSQLQNIARDARVALGPLPVNDVTGALFSLCDAIVDRSA
jgi:heptaprenyl diphosphate synthase